MDKNFVIGGTEVQAFLFDLDGTLYHQGPVRRRMMLELALLPLRSLSPSASLRALKRIRRFRKTREELRERGQSDESLEELQYTEPAGRMGDDPGELRATIEEWMERRPLPCVGRSQRKGLRAFLERLQGAGARLGVYSDYPVREKLEAMGVLDCFSLLLSSVDPEINAFKPHPRGFEHAAEQWGLPPSRILYVGDRADVDARGAQAAGMPCGLLRPRNDGDDPWTFTSLQELSDAIALPD